MLEHGRLSTRRQRLSFGRAGAIGTEHLLGAALVILIVGSLALSIYHFVGGDEIKPIDRVFRFKCAACKEEFEIDAKDLDQHIGEEFWGDEMESTRIDCIKCGAKRKAVMMTQCPKCGHWYVSKRTILAGRPDADIEGLRNICPSCGTDEWEYRHKQREEKRKNK